MEVREQISEIANRHGIALAARPHQSGDGDEIIAIVDRLSKLSNLRAFQREVRQTGLNVTIRFSDSVEDSFTEALTESLEKRFKSDILFSKASPSPNAVLVSVIYKQNETFSASDIRAHIDELASLFSINRLKVTVSERAISPGMTELLQIVRISAPVSCEQMQSLVVKRGYPEPSLEWINHQFDLHRKKGFLLRREDRTYLLTHQGLAALGSGKSRLSPDIRRILELARSRK